MRWSALLVVVLAASVVAERASGLVGVAAIGDLLAGLALLGAGAAAWRLGGRRPLATLFAASGATWFLGDVFSPLLYLHWGPLAQLILTYPSARTRSRPVIVVVGGAYVAGLAAAAVGPDSMALALGVALMAAAALRHRGATGVERRACAAALAASIAVGGVLAVAAAGRIAGAQGGVGVLLAYDAAVAVSAMGLAADLRWGRWTEAAVTGLVVDVGELERPSSLRAKLAGALGDPGLVVAYPLADGDGYVDEDGRAVALPPAGDRRATTLVEDDGRPVAVLLHDAAVLDDVGLVAAVTSAARLAVANARLQAEVRARLAEVDASRRRIVDAGDRQRRRLQHEISGGPERRLAAVAERLDGLAAGAPDGRRAAVLPLSEELEAGREALRRFAAGLHPAVLADEGLAPAIAELAAQSPVPVTVAVDERRLPAPLEAAAYFVCSEALANIAKYAAATRADVRVVRLRDLVCVTVADDGEGGADPGRGSGLRGLADRVEALGGALRVASPPGGGTTVEAVLPTPAAGRARVR